MSEAAKEAVGDYLLDINEMRSVYGDVSRSTILRWYRTGRVPKPVDLSPGVLRWRASEVRRHLDNLPTREGNHD